MAMAIDAEVAAALASAREAMISTRAQLSSLSQIGMPTGFRSHSAKWLQSNLPAAATALLESAHMWPAATAYAALDVALDHGNYIHRGQYRIGCSSGDAAMWAPYWALHAAQAWFRHHLPGELESAPGSLRRAAATTIALEDCWEQVMSLREELRGSFGVSTEVLRDPAFERVKFTLPEGVSAGQKLRVTAPSGRACTVAVPEGVVAGQLMQAKVPVTGVVKAPAAQAPAKRWARETPGVPTCADMHQLALDLNLAPRSSWRLVLSTILEPFVCSILATPAMSEGAIEAAARDVTPLCFEMLVADELAEAMMGPNTLRPADAIGHHEFVPVWEHYWGDCQNGRRDAWLELIAHLAEGVASATGLQAIQRWLGLEDPAIVAFFLEEVADQLTYTTTDDQSERAAACPQIYTTVMRFACHTLSALEHNCHGREHAICQALAGLAYLMRSMPPTDEDAQALVRSVESLFASHKGPLVHDCFHDEMPRRDDDDGRLERIGTLEEFRASCLADPVRELSVQQTRRMELEARLQQIIAPQQVTDWLEVLRSGEVISTKEWGCETEADVDRMSLGELRMLAKRLLRAQQGETQRGEAVGEATPRLVIEYCPGDRPTLPGDRPRAAIDPNTVLTHRRSIVTVPLRQADLELAVSAPTRAQLASPHTRICQ